MNNFNELKEYFKMMEGKLAYTSIKETLIEFQDFLKTEFNLDSFILDYIDDRYDDEEDNDTKLILYITNSKKIKNASKEIMMFSFRRANSFPLNINLRLFGMKHGFSYFFKDCEDKEELTNKTIEKIKIQEKFGKYINSYKFFQEEKK